MPNKRSPWLTTLNVTLAIVAISVAILAWRYPQSPPQTDLTELPQTAATLPILKLLLVPVEPSNPDQQTKLQCSPTNKQVQAANERYRRTVKVYPGTDDWTDTGIILRRNQKILVGSPDRVFVEINDAESSFQTIDNDMGPEGQGDFGEGYRLSWWSHNGDGVGALVLDTNLILGSRDFDTLKVRASYDGSNSEPSDEESDEIPDGSIIVIVITDYEAWRSCMYHEDISI